jgi:hypothetical protein
MLVWRSHDQRWAMTGHSEGASTVREPLAAHRHLLARSVLLTQKDDKARILILAAEGVDSPGRAEPSRLLDGNAVTVSYELGIVRGREGHFAIERLAPAWLGAPLNDAAVHNTQLAAFQAEVPGLWRQRRRRLCRCTAAP